MDNYINETSGNPEYEKWADKLSNMSDREASYEIYQQILKNGNLDKESAELLTLSYNYCLKLIDQGKPLEPNLLKIYLKDIKGKDIAQINVINLFALLALCGINFSN